MLGRVKILEGKLKARKGVIAVVVSKFNEFITENLLSGCLDELNKSGVGKSSIVVAKVPGAFEIPLIARKFVEKTSVKAVICLGAVIRGETKHYDLVAEECARGIASVSLESGKPLVFEVLATDTIEDAYKRSDDNGVNKGRDAARACVEMIDLLERVGKYKK